MIEALLVPSRQVSDRRQIGVKTLDAKSVPFYLSTISKHPVHHAGGGSSTKSLRLHCWTSILGVVVELIE